MSKNRIALWTANVAIVCGMLFVMSRIYELQSQNAEMLWLIRVTEAAIDTTGSARLVVDRTGIVRNWNDNARKLMGFTEQQAVGQNAIFIIPREFRERHTESFFKASKEVEPTKVMLTNCEVLTVSGDRIPVHIRVTPAKIGGDTYFMVLIDAKDDVTETDLLK